MTWLRTLLPDCAWRSGMEHATVLEGERKVCPIDDSSRMLAPRPGLTSGLTSGQWLSITDIPWLRAVCEDPAVPLFCFDCPWSCKADPRVGYCSKATHHMFCLLQLLSGHRNHAAAAGYSRRDPPNTFSSFLAGKHGRSQEAWQDTHRPRSST